MKKLLLSLFIVLVITCGILLVAKDQIAKAVFPAVVKAAYGLRASAETVHVGILKPSLHITGATIYNPQGYQDQLLAQVSELYVAYDPASFLSGKIHLGEIRLHVKELFIVQDKSLRYNVGAIAAMPSSAVFPAQKTQAPGQASAKAAAPKVSIDILSLRIDRVVYKDYSVYPGPRVIELTMSINQTFENVTDLSKLAGQIMTRLLGNAGLSQLLGAGFKPAQGQVGAGIADTLGAAGIDTKKIFGQ